MERALPNLDHPETYTQTDPTASHHRLMDMAGQISAARQIVLAWTPPALPVPPRAVLIAGMGGSAIGGDLLRALAAGQSTIPILVHRDYGLPAYAGPHTLVIACSYSGQTEETLSAAEAAHERGAPIVAITTGGRLAQRAQAWGAALLPFNYSAQPREALGYLLLLLMGALVRLDLLPDPTTEVEEAAAALQALRQEIDVTAPLDRNPAKELAHWLHGYIPAVYGSGPMAPVARRWKGQFNENAKSWALCEELPEMDHNAVCGTALPAGSHERIRGLFLASGQEHPRNRLRLEATRRIMEEAGVACRTVAGRGHSPLAQALTAALLGDATSYYLALLYGVDPGHIQAIAALKEVLAQAEKA